MDDSARVDALLRQLDSQREAVNNTFQQLHELLANSLASSGSTAVKGTATPPTFATAEPRSPRSPRPSVVSQATFSKDLQSRKEPAGTLQTSSASRATGEDSDHDDDDESYFAQTPLEPQSYEHEGLRQHLRSYKWTEYDRKILSGIVGNPARISQPTLFPTTPGPVDDRSHLSHYQVFDVAADGAPLPVEFPESEKAPSNALAIWNSIKDINQPGKERRAVGRITVLREPSPILYGAAHYTMHKIFDVDELFRHLVDHSSSSANVHRTFDLDERRQRSFVFNLEYFTILGDDCMPQDWQMATLQKERKKHHIPITRCSSVIALALGGKPIRKIRNSSRRQNPEKTSDYGYAYDPFGPYQVANIQAYPDWKASTDIHDSSRNYVNGVEAFLVTLLGELRDAESRFEDIYRRISKLVVPPLEFMFDIKVRDKLLFEDTDFTYVRRYFWAQQTLNIVNESIKHMIDAFEDTFTEEVWEGKHKTLWPLVDPESPRNVFFKKRLAVLRKKFEKQIGRLRVQMEENDKRREEIESLREDLYVGTSVQESRKSVENTEITIQQGHNIKILTLVSIFFLPLTFVTSVFGMTNMPTAEHYWTFGIVTATVCIPFFILIGSLNTHSGMEFWKTAIFGSFGKLFGHGSSKPQRKASGDDTGDDTGEGVALSRMSTVNDNRFARLRRWSTAQQNRNQSKDSIDLKTLEVQSPRPTRPSIFSRSPSSRIAEMWTAESLKKTTSV